MEKPSFWEDAKASQDYMKEIKELKATIEKFD